MNEHPPAPPDPTRTSALATASLVVGLLACVPLIGLVAIGLSGAALVRIRRSRGALGGQALALTAMGLGLFNLAGTGALALGYMAADDAITLAPVVAPPPALPPPPRPTGPAPGSDDGQMTTIDQVTETVLAPGVLLVDVPPTVRTLRVELADQQRKVDRPGKLLLFTTSEDCRPCLGASVALNSPEMREALKQSRVVRVDTGLLAAELRSLGVAVDKIPGFYLLGPDLRPVDGVTGGEWDDDTTANIAPVLVPFLRGTYRKRREAFTPLPPETPGSVPGKRRPRGTFL